MLTRSIKDGAPHPVVASGARQLLDMAEAERSGVVSTALSYLALYRDPIVAKATEASDFAIENLVTGARPVSIYVVAPPEELSRLRPVLRLFFNQALKRLTETAGATNGKGRRVLVMFDEFVQLGRLDFFENALAYIRGYKVKVCMAAQSLNQIAKTYDENNSILDNAHVRVAFACNDERTAKRISDMLGSTTETRSQMNYAGSRMAPWLGHTMVSRQEAARPLLTPGEIMQLPADECLILTGGAPPIRARKVRYFSAPLFADRVRPKPGLKTQTGPGKPTDWDSIAPLLSDAARPRSARPTPSSSTGQQPSASHEASNGPAARQQTFEFAQAPGRGDPTPEPARPNGTEIQGAEDGDDLDAALKPVTNPLQQAFLERGGFNPGITED
jgi:type IV secretion system protein VirD4